MYVGVDLHSFKDGGCLRIIVAIFVVLFGFLFGFYFLENLNHRYDT